MVMRDRPRNNPAQTLDEEITEIAANFGRIQKNALLGEVRSLDTAESAGSEIDKIGRPNARVISEAQLRELKQLICRYI